MARAISTKTLFEKVYKTFSFDGIWLSILGVLSKGGIWVVYGDEKNGKTTVALQIAEYLSKHEKVWYLSAEQGTDKEFQATAKIAGVNPKNSNIKWSEYIPIDELRSYLAKRQSPKIVFIDNATVYVDDLKYGALRKLLLDFPEVTFILVAHMESNEPYTATAKLAKKLAKVIIRVEGLTAFISGRCPGGTIIINDEKAMLIHGSQIKEKQS
jgi:DNA polymerase III delta prime subunit